jgi:hypothetical protein
MGVEQEGRRGKVVEGEKEGTRQRRRRLLQGGIVGGGSSRWIVRQGRFGGVRSNQA